MLFESDNMILSKGGKYVDKGYPYDWIYKLNFINDNSFSAYMVVSFDVWHGRLGHINMHAIKRMVKVALILITVIYVLQES